ncbi:hypothetical protein [Actinomadura sp. 21ATH]|uniref:hypothetical protein n=1 Tax=Actinomadura sp. 21ATH TaxID=1735444 RepID=UPI0035C23870
MTMNRLPEALHDLSERHPVPDAPTDTLVRRGRRARLRRRATISGIGTGTAAVALAAALAMGNTVAPDDPSVPAGPGTAVTLASATEATARTTFQVKMTWTLAQRGHKSHGEVYVGAFDAANRRGHLRGPHPRMQWRFVGGETYLSRGEDHWQRRDSGLASFTRGTTGPQEFAADPGRVLRMFGSLGTVTSEGRSGTGAAAVETYAFTHAARPAEGSPAGTRVTGTITIGLASRKVEKIVQSTVIRSQDPSVERGGPVRFTSVMEFSRFGTPVQVTRPAVGR